MGKAKMVALEIKELVGKMKEVVKGARGNHMVVSYKGGRTLKS